MAVSNYVKILLVVTENKECPFLTKISVKKIIKKIYLRTVYCACAY